MSQMIVTVLGLWLSQSLGLDRDDTGPTNPCLNGGTSQAIVIKMKPGLIPESDESVGIREVDQSLARHGLLKISRVYEGPFKNEALAKEIGLDRYYLVSLSGSADELVAELRGREFSEIFDSVDNNGIGSIATDPNDPHFNLQYALKNIGQELPMFLGPQAGLPDADADAEAAWAYTEGSPNVILAVVDSGVSMHPEYVGRMVNGYNSVLNLALPFSDPRLWDTDCPHGTHCTGIAAATSDNSQGIAGIAPRIKIMPVKVLCGCFGSEAQCAAGVLWATDNGANVITMSLQYYQGANILRDSMTYAWQLGVLPIAASGNAYQSNMIAYPAAYEHCMAVGSTDNRDQHSNFSNGSPQLDLSAPGEGIYSTFIAVTNSGQITDYTYAFLSGTSMATPLVAGIACLMRSLNPSLSNEQIVKVLRETAENRGPSGFDPLIGAGRVNAGAAVRRAQICIPDFNLDLQLNAIDFMAYMNAFAAREARADLNRDGLYNALDFIVFQNRFAQGCWH